MANDFRFGIEEEFFLVDADTKSAARAMPKAFLEAAKKATGGQVTGERPEPAFLIAKPFQPSAVSAVISQALFFERNAHRSDRRATA